MIADEKGIKEAVRSALLPLWNAWYFFTLYANADGRRADPAGPPSDNLLDRYILAKLRDTTGAVTLALDSYDLSGACAAVESFLDVLTNWYIRRSRDRFWGTGAGRESDTQAAFDTLGRVIEHLCRLAAPLMPLVTESIWTDLTGGESVHLMDWPDEESLSADPDLVTAMDLVRDVCSAGHSVRKAANLRARLPLAALTVAGPEVAQLAPFTELIADEVNVRSVILSEDAGAYAATTLTVAFKVAAPRLGPATQAAAAAARTGDWEILADGRARVGASLLDEDEFDMSVTPLDESTTRPLPGRAGVVVLDLVVTEDLALEGSARDLVRIVQSARRDTGLDVTDRIHLEIAGPDHLDALLAAHGEWVAEQVLAASVGRAGDAGGPGWVQAELADGTPVSVRVSRT